MKRLSLLALAPLVSACQFLFPTPIDQHADAGTPGRAVRTVGATFAEGEALDVQLSLDGVSAGRGALRVGKRCLADSTLALPITVEGGSTGLISLLANAEAETLGLMDVDTSLPLESTWDVTTGEKRSELQMDYRPGGYRVHQVKHEPGKDPKHSRRKVDLPIEQVPHDAHTLIGYLRRWEPADGERGYVYVTAGRALYRADLIFTGRDALVTPQGSQEAFRIDGVATRISEKTLKPIPKGERPFSMWISTDERRTPLRIVIETEVTKIEVDLLRYRKEPVPEGPPKPCEARVDRAELDKAKGKKKGEPEAAAEPEVRDDEPGEPRAGDKAKPAPKPARKPSRRVPKLRMLKPEPNAP